MSNAMQYIVPPIFAAVGFFIGGPQGAQIGWMIGSYAGSALTKRSGDAPLTAMPQGNQATRGANVFMTFGANRIGSSQMVWSKNYSPILHNSGGKGGGSGAPPNAGQQPYYTYNWDLMYNFGMVDAPSFVRNAWAWQKKVSLVTTESWASNLPVGIFSAFPVLVAGSPSVTTELVTLTAEEAFYAPGWPTGSENIETWPYFQTQEGVACQWPYTAWLGFKQLDLGPSPTIPQLAVELVPIGGAELTFNSGFINKVTATTMGGAQFNAYASAGQMMMLGEDGKHYVYVKTNVTHSIVCIETGAVRNIVLADIVAALTPSGHTTWGSFFTIAPVPGKAQFFAFVADPDGTRYYIGVANFKIDSTGTVVAYRYMVGRTSGLANGIVQGVAGVTWFRDLELERENIYIAASVTGVGIGTEQTSLFTLPLNDYFNDTTPGTFEAAFVRNMTGLGAKFFDPGVGGDKRPDLGMRATIILNDGVPEILTYVSQAMVDSAVSVGNTIIDNATEPCFVLCQGVGAPDILTIGDTQSDFINIPDIMTKYDGTPDATAYSNDYTSPTLVMGNGEQFLVFARGFQDKAEYQRVRVFWLNDLAPAGPPVTVPVATVTGRVLDTVVDLGASSPNRDTAYPYLVQAGYEVDEGKIWTMAYHRNNLTIDQMAFARFGDFTPVSGDEDVTPAYIVYRILTHPVFGVQAAQLFGFTITADRIDTTSYETARTFCEDEGIKVATTYTNSGNFLTVLDTLLNLYGGYLVDIGGKIVFGIARDTDDTGRTIDNGHLLVDKQGTPPVMITEPAPQDSFNIINYSYLDRALDYHPNQVSLSDEVDVDLTGPRPMTFPPQFVMAGSLAQMQCERMLWMNLYGRRIYDFKLGWKDADLCQGDVVTLVDSFDVTLSAGKKVRIARKVEKKKGKFEITATEHIPYYLTANRDFTNTTSLNVGGSYVNTPQLCSFRMYELPKEFQASTGRLFVGYNQLSTVMGAQLYISLDGSNFTFDQNIMPFCISGIFPQALPNRAPGYMEEQVDVYLMPTSPFDVATPTFCQTHAWDNVTQGMRSVGSCVLICGSEAIGIQDLTLVGQNHYRIAKMFRGWGGTPIAAITSGALWHQHGVGTFDKPITENDIGVLLYYKVVPYNFANVIYNVASVDARTYEIKGDYWLPRHSTPLRIWVDTPVAWTNSAPATGPYLAVTSGGCDVKLTWPDAAQQEGYGAGGYGAGGYGHFTADVLTPAWRVDVYSVNGTAVSSFVANTGYFNYTLGQNSTDFNGFGRDVIFKVTPYNVKGDGPVSSVRSLSLFW